MVMRLFALGLQPVEQQRKIDLRSAGAVSSRIAFERSQMIVENQVLLRRAAGRAKSIFRRRPIRR